jgi:hypothetical protein
MLKCECEREYERDKEAIGDLTRLHNKANCGYFELVKMAESATHQVYLALSHALPVSQGAVAAHLPPSMRNAESPDAAKN